MANYATLQDALSFDRTRDILHLLNSDQEKLLSFHLAKNQRHNYYSYNYKPNTDANTPIIFAFNVNKKQHELPGKIVDFALTNDQNNHHNTKWDIAIQTVVDGHHAVVMTPFETAEKQYGLKFTKNLTLIMNDIEKPFTDWREVINNCGSYNYTSRSNGPFDFTLDHLNNLIHRKFKNISKENLQNLLTGLLNNHIGYTKIVGSGISKTMAKCNPYIEEIKNDNPIAWCYIRSLIKESNRTIDSVKISVILNSILQDVDSKEALLKAVNFTWNKKRDDYWDPIVIRPETALKELPIWKEKRKAVLKSQGNRAFVKLMEEYDSLSLDEKKYPKTAEAIKNSELPLSTFFRKQEQYFLVNNNWELWEKMLTKHRAITLELANTVKSRSTYEKDLMSYFYFILYALPSYLKKHTGKKWTCFPKLVDSPSELEPPTADSDGVARKRSALTPIVDNEKNEVVVPYASLAMPGRQTVYCYAHDYHVLTSGFSYKGNVVMREIEEKLNGRDDYGLMFYTFTGSPMGRGYPTFLIIFERRSRDTVVHFHRVHPCRSKDGDENPIHTWTSVCYNWMAGNINKKNIKAQQGDLVFVHTDKEVNFTQTVTSYDKHCFERAVQYAEGSSEKSSNILCYVNLTEDTVLQHTEHENVLIPAGQYAIHQVRSWEANPRGVWVGTID